VNAYSRAPATVCCRCRIQSNDIARLFSTTCNKLLHKRLSAIHAVAALFMEKFGVWFGCTPVPDNNELLEE